MKTTRLIIGIADYETIKRHTMEIARGEYRPGPNEPRVWFPSIDSVAKVFSANNRELLSVIEGRKPNSIDELAMLTGRKQSNVSRTLRTMEKYGIVSLTRGQRGRVVPSVKHKEFIVRFDLAASSASRELAKQ
jgi:predicted transcriptional regulator